LKKTNLAHRESVS